MIQQGTINTGADRERIHTAQQMMTAFFVLAKTARVYETGNDSYRSQLTRFYNLLAKYMTDCNNCTVKVADERIFVDEKFINIENDDRIGVHLMTARWDELGIGGMIIGESVSPDHITALVLLLSTFSTSRGNPVEEFNERLVMEGVDSIVVLPHQTIDPDQQVNVENCQRIRHEARQTFFRAIDSVKQVMTAASNMQTISMTRTKRVVHTIIDQLSTDESALLELASIRDFDDYTYAHSVNVSIYSLAVGFRLGLERMELSELGFASLFHDIGKVKLPQDLVTKADRFDEFDWSQMRRHPIFGAMTLANSLKLDSHAARAMAVAFEHHINPDHSGYPTLPEPRPTNLYSRIIAITDSFDALTSGRVYIKEAIPPDEVLRKLMYQMAVKFDAFLLKLFANIIGIFPVGSLVLLTDGSLGIVTRPNRLEINRPELRLIADRSGPLSPPRWCNLAEPANRAIDIVRIIDAKKHSVDVTGYILSE